MGVRIGRTVEEIVDYALRLSKVVECSLDPVPVTTDEFPVLLAHVTKLSARGPEVVSINDLLCGHRMEIL
jgi:hypothetical protein